MRGSKKNTETKKPPLYMVTRKEYNGREMVLMWTDDESCVDDAETIQSIIKGGCTVYFSGQEYEPKKRKTKK